MDSFDQLDNLGPEDYLVEAIDRLSAGEPLDAILTSCPAGIREALSEMLDVVDSMQHFASVPPPPIPAARKAAAKERFLATAAEMQRQAQAVTLEDPVVRSANHSHNPGPPTAEPPGAAPHNIGHHTTFHGGTELSERTAQPGSLSRIVQELGIGFQNLFGFAPMRLAPLAVLVAIMLLGSASVFTVAWSIPGDLTYPIKEWSRRVGLRLVTESEREAIREAQDKARAQELAQAFEKADRNSVIITETVTEIYQGHQTGNDLLNFGAATVMPRYQPDANANTEFLPMQIVGELLPGAEVELTYQIMPGQQSQTGIVQGISVRVIAPPPTPTPLPTPTMPPPTHTTAPTATSPPRLPANSCVVNLLAGWVPYVMGPNETLGGVAVRGGVSTRYLTDVNCLESASSIQSGMTIFAPGVEAPTASATNTPFTTPISPAGGIINDAPVITATVTGTGADQGTDLPVSTPVVSGTLPVGITVTATINPDSAATPVATGTVVVGTPVTDTLPTAAPVETPVIAPTEIATGTLPAPGNDESTAIATPVVPSGTEETPQTETVEATREPPSCG